MVTRILSSFAILFIALLTSNSSFAQESLTKHHPNEPVSQHYEGGLEKLNSDIKAAVIYPAMARKTRRQGNCIIHIRIAADGTVSDYELISNIGAGCGAEALRVVKTLKFNPPGYDRDYKIAVNFSLK